jgi:hypothetical protein
MEEMVFSATHLNLNANPQEAISAHPFAYIFTPVNGIVTGNKDSFFQA